MEQKTISRVIHRQQRKNFIVYESMINKQGKKKKVYFNKELFNGSKNVEWWCKQ